MAGEITKEELNALMTVQSKSVEQQVLIAERLKVIVDTQEKTLNRLQNGLAKEISDKVVTCNKDVELEVKEVKKETSDIKKDTTWLKWLFGSIGLIVALSMVFINIYWLSQKTATEHAIETAVHKSLVNCSINERVIINREE